MIPFGLAWRVMAKRRLVKPAAAEPARNYQNTSFTETPTSIAREERPTVEINKDDCVALGISVGDRVRLENDLGDLVIYVEVTGEVEPGIVVVQSVWPNSSFEEGIGISLLTSAELTAPTGGAVYHDTAVWIRLKTGNQASRG